MLGVQGVQGAGCWVFRVFRMFRVLGVRSAVCSGCWVFRVFSVLGVQGVQCVHGRQVASQCETGVLLIN